MKNVNIVHFKIIWLKNFYNVQKIETIISNPEFDDDNKITKITFNLTNPYNLTLSSRGEYVIRKVFTNCSVHYAEVDNDRPKYGEVTKDGGINVITKDLEFRAFHEYNFLRLLNIELQPYADSEIRLHIECE